MKNILNIAFVVVLVLCVNSCKKNNVAVDKTITPPLSAEIVSNTKVFSKSYYVRSDGTPYALPVGLTTPSGTDQTIQFTYSSSTGAVLGTQYNAPASLTIKAGQTIDTLRITGAYASYPLGKQDVIKVKISGGVPGVYLRDSMLLSLQRYCDVVLPNFTGNYASSADTDPSGTYGPYTANVTSVVSTGPSTAKLTIANFAFAELAPNVPSPITVNIDFSDPGNFQTTIPAQIIYPGNFFGYGPLTISGVGTGTFSSCYNTFTMSYTLTVSAGSFGDYSTTLAR